MPEKTQSIETALKTLREQRATAKDKATRNRIEQTIQKLEAQLADQQWPSLRNDVLPTTGAAGEVVGNVLGAPLEMFGKYNPVGYASKSLMGAYGSALGETDMGQAAGQWMAENPETVGTTMDVLNTMELFPPAKLTTTGIKGALNTASQNLQTKLPGFYTGDPIGAVQRGFSPEAWLKDMWTPQGRANLREKGTGSNRVAELDKIMEAGEATGDARKLKQNEIIGNLKASKYIRNQIDRKTESNTLIENLPINKAHVRGAVRGSDKEGFKELMMSDMTPEQQASIPDHILKKFTVDDPRRLGSRSGKEVPFAVGSQLAGGRVGIPDPERAIMIVNDKGAYGTDLAAELYGKKPGINAPVSKAPHMKGTISSAEKLYGKPQGQWAPEDWKDYYALNSLTERARWFGEGELKKLTAQLPKEKRWLAEKMTGNVGPGVRSTLPESYRSSSQSAVISAYLAAKNTQKKYAETGKGKKPTDNQLALIKSIDAAKKKHGGQVVYDKENNTIDYVGSYLSSEQALGGVGYRVSHDLNTNTVYSNVIDGHDISGADPAGGDQLMNFLPIQAQRVGPLENVDLGKATPEVAAREAAAVKRVEEMTGMMRGKDEGLLPYQTRVVRDWQAPKSYEDYMDPAVNAALTGIGLFNTTGENEP